MGSPTKPKQFSLTDGETKNIRFRRMVMDYLADVVNNDMGRYLYTEVRTRLNLPEDVQIEISEDATKITVTEKDKILKP